MSRDAALQQLAQTLRISADQLPDLESLSPENISALDRMLQTSRVQQRKSMDQAIDKGLEHIPSLLRGAVKKIVRG